MGWSDACVMGGDSPMDWEANLCEKAGGHYDDDEGNVYTREQLESKLPELLAYIEGCRGDQGIGFQVLGVMLLGTGAELTSEAKAKITKAAENDEWASEDRERQVHMQDLIECVQNHEPGTPTEVPSEKAQAYTRRKMMGERFGPVRVGVAVILRRDDRAVLMGQRKGAHGAGTWSFPGGHLEWGENINEAASRELLEETGIEIEPKAFRKLTFTNDLFKRERCHYITLYVEADWDGEVQPEVKEPDKCGEWRWTTEAPPKKALFLPIKNLLKERHPGLVIWS